MGDIKDMIKCVYCDRELKSAAGKIRHESFCKAREVGGQTEEEIASLVDIAEEISNDVDAIIENAEIKVGTIDELYPDNVPATEIVKSTNNVVQLEVLGGEETYYDGHPRRVTKLKGLLSRTFDRAERHKIQQLILKVENETYKG